MTDIFFPADVPVAKVAPRLVDSTGRFTSPLNGAVRTVARPGSRWGLRLDFQNLYQRDRARLEAFIARMRGAENRALISPPDYQQRGSFPSQELFLNNSFAAGAANWTPGAGVTIAAADRRLRVTYLGSGIVDATQAVGTISPNQPHVARYFLVDGMGAPLASNALASFIEGANVTNNVTSAEGLNVVSLVPDAAGTQYLVWGLGGSGNLPQGFVAGAYVDALWTSLSRCFLVDNAPNMLLQSNTLTAAQWADTACSLSASAIAAPDGSGNAWNLLETTANSGHFVSQTVTISAGANVDYAWTFTVRANLRTWCFLEITETLGGTLLSQYYNLSTGALGATIGTGANWANNRSYVANMGNGWYRLTIIGRKTNAATQLTASLGAATGDGGGSYAGNSTSAALVCWNSSFAQSSLPVAETVTTTSAASAQPQSGTALRVKGLPVSASALLLPGDWAEVNKELKRCTSQLDSDGSGRGFLQFSPPLRNSPNDNDPVIVNMPMGRFLLSAPENGWQTDPGFVSSSSLDFVEAA